MTVAIMITAFIFGFTLLIYYLENSTEIDLYFKRDSESVANLQLLKLIRGCSVRSEANNKLTNPKFPHLVVEGKFSSRGRGVTEITVFNEVDDTFVKLSFDNSIIFQLLADEFSKNHFKAIRSQQRDARKAKIGAAHAEVVRVLNLQVKG